MRLNDLAIRRNLGRVDNTYFNERRQEESAIARQMFGIPELAAKILSHLKFIDLERMTRISMKIRDIIDDSPKLQRKLSLLPDPEITQAWFPFNTVGWGVPYTGFRCRSNDTTCTDTSGLERVPMTASFSRRTTPDVCRGVKSRFRNMFICQPPIQEMRVKIERDKIKLPPLCAEPGITFGDVLDYHFWCLEKYERKDVKYTGSVVCLRKQPENKRRRAD